MVLLQIAEPGAALEITTERQIGVGIDLGTTNSLIAHFDLISNLEAPYVNKSIKFGFKE